MTHERVSPLDPKERLQLAALVNKFCEIMPGEVTDTDKFVEDAQQIVRMLDSRIRPNQGSFSGFYKGRSASFKAVGMTNAGLQDVRLDNDGKREIKIGNPDEYRIGLYVVTKMTEGKKASLSFVNFWDYNTGQIISAHARSDILYNKNDLSLKAVLKSYPYLFTLGRLNIIYFRTFPVWGKGKLLNHHVEILY